MLKIRKQTILELFQSYQQKEGNFWSLNELIKINEENHFGFEKHTLQEILQGFLETADSQDQTLNPKELAQILGFRIQTSNDIIIRMINERMQDQIQRLTEMQYRDILQQQKERELERLLQFERSKTEKIQKDIKERQQKEAISRRIAEEKEKEERDYQKSKTLLPSLTALDNKQEQSIQVNKHKFWKNFKSIVQQTGFQPIISKRQDSFISAKAFYQALVEDYAFTNCLELRDFVDSIAPNKKINIPKLREKLKLPPDNYVPDTKEEDLVLPDKMVEEIKDLFNVSDKDHSGSIEKNEIEQLLISIGINAKDEELDFYFKKFDKNGDQKISFDEFKIIMTQQIYSEMLSVRDIIDDLQTLFRRVDINNEGSLNKHQMNHVFTSLGIVLTEDELEQVFKAIDLDQNQTVQITELVDFIKFDCRKLSGLLASAVIKTKLLLKIHKQIRSCRKPRISELKKVFENLPSNCILSFTYNRIKIGLNLPSFGIKPKINSLSGTIKDLNLANDPSIKHTLLKSKKTVNDIIAEIVLSKAVCLPLPLEKEHLQKIKHMEVVMCLYDKQRRKFMSNTCIVLVQSDNSKQTENTWNFFNEENSSVYLRYANYNEKRDSEIQVIFEYILHYEVIFYFNFLYLL